VSKKKAKKTSLQKSSKFLLSSNLYCFWAQKLLMDKNKSILDIFIIFHEYFPNFFSNPNTLHIMGGRDKNLKVL